MKTNNEILRYLAGMLSEEQKRELEGRLGRSPALRKELQEKSELLGQLKSWANPQADTHYFENLLPAVREKLSLQKKKKFSFYPRLAYVIPILAVIAFFVSKPLGLNPFYKPGGSSSEFTRAVSEMNDQARTEILGSLLENESSTSQASAFPENATEEVSEAVENRMGEELYKGTDTKSQYLDTDELISTVSNDEAEDIYQNMIHKKIL